MVLSGDVPLVTALQSRPSLDLRREERAVVALVTVEAIEPAASAG